MTVHAPYYGNNPESDPAKQQSEMGRRHRGTTQGNITDLGECDICGQWHTPRHCPVD